MEQENYIIPHSLTQVASIAPVRTRQSYLHHGSGVIGPLAEHGLSSQGGKKVGTAYELSFASGYSEGVHTEHRLKDKQQEKGNEHLHTAEKTHLAI